MHMRHSLKNKFTLVILSFFACIPTLVKSQQNQQTKKEELNSVLMNSKEVFRYEVHYGPFLLGHVDISEIKDTVYLGEKAFYYKMIMHSNPKLWFVGNKEEHHFAVFQSYKNKSYGLLFWSDDIDSKIQEEVKISTNYQRNVTVTEFRDKYQNYRKKEIPLSPYALVGPDIFLFSRFFAGKDTMVKSPIYVDSLIQTINLDYTSNQEKRFYPAFKDSIEATKMYGDAPFEGPFGFKGKFIAWFGSDSLHIPLEAHADVWIGFVKIKLVRYQRVEEISHLK
jgi:hypothetical protein